MRAIKSVTVTVESPPSAPAGRFGGRALAAVASVGAATSLAWACLRALRHPRIYLPLTFAQVWEIGIGSLPLVLLVAMLSGAVTSEQTGYQYSSTLPPWIVGSVITASVVSELGPLSTGFVLIGRVGARIGAELGAMSVTEQIQALRTLGRDPVVYLVLPQVLAALIAVPALDRESPAPGGRCTAGQHGGRPGAHGADPHRHVGGIASRLRVAGVDPRQDRPGTRLYQALLAAAAHADEAALGALGALVLVRDLHDRPERYLRISLF
jgi:Permease MlaE